MAGTDLAIQAAGDATDRSGGGENGAHTETRTDSESAPTLLARTQTIVEPA